MYLYYAREKLLEHESHVQSKVLGIRIEGIEFGKIVHKMNIKMCIEYVTRRVYIALKISSLPDILCPEILLRPR